MAGKPVQSKELLVAGLFAMAMGGMTMLAIGGYLPGKGGGLHAPVWVAVCGGLVFVLAGGALVLRWLAGGTADDGEMPHGTPLWMRFVYYAAGLIVIGALATIGTWVAFGPGERAFSVSAPSLGSGPANPWIGRTAFGIGAALTWLFFIVAAVAWWRKLMQRERA